MPAILDRCVTDFLNDKRNMERWPDLDERKQHAYPICNASIKTSEGEFSYFVDLHGVQLSDDNSTWVQALLPKTFQHPMWGTIDITPDRINRFAANVNNGIRGQMLDVDYEHKKDPAKGNKAAGWITAADVRNDSLWLKAMFTPTAAQEIRDGEWKYFSPEFQDEWCDPVTKDCHKDVLFGGALTNRPFVKNMLPVNLSEIDPEVARMAEQFHVPSNKFMHEDANYRLAEVTMRRCGGCAFFRAPRQATEGSCLVVNGEIERDHVCNFFTQLKGGGMPEILLSSDGLDPIFFRDISQSERKGHPASDFAGKGNSFPIFKCADVDAAFHSIGRAGSDNYSSDQLRANITRIAKAKGFESCLPKSVTKKAAEVPSQFKTNMDHLKAGHGLDDSDVMEGKEGSTPDAEDMAEAHNDAHAGGVFAANQQHSHSMLYGEEVTGLDLKQLAELLGIEEDEAKVTERIKALVEAAKVRDSKDDKARKFAEEFPEEAKQLAEAREANKNNETTLKLTEWHRGEGKGGLPPVHDDKIKAIRFSLSEADAAKFDELIGEVVKTGLVPFTPAGDVGGHDEDAVTQFEELIKAEMKDNDKLTYAEAMKIASRKNRTLAEQYRQETKTMNETG